MELAVLRCDSCGAALPLDDGDVVACPVCGVRSAVPETHRALRVYAGEARANRREAERLYRALVSRAPPEVVANRFGLFGIPSLVVGVPALLYATQDVAAWGVRTWIAFGVFVPSLVGILVFVGLGARANPLAYLHATGARLRPGIPTPSGSPSCGACGAPLRPEPDALAATCDYCLADSWLVDVTDDHVEGTARAKENLAMLVRGAELHSFEMWTFAAISTVVVGAFVALIYLC